MRNIKTLGISLIVAATLSIGFTGCGGGGDSSSGSSLSFPSNAVSAEPTIENGEKVEEVVTQDPQTMYSINSVNSSNTQNIALTMKQLNEVLKEKVDLNYYSLNETINETESCSNGGTIKISGSGSETGGATIDMTFNNCDYYDVSLDGKITTSMSNYNSTYDDYANISMTFVTDFTVSTSGITAKIIQGSTTKLEYSNFTGWYEADKLKMTISAISEVNGIKTGQRDAVYYFSNLTSTPSMYQTSGKIYIDNLASYVDYDTSYDMSQTPFIFNGSGLDSGEAHYIMSNGGKLKIVVEGGAVVVYIDADGNGDYELNN